MRKRAARGEGEPRTCSGARGGTRGFRAPEVLLREKKQTTAIDVWAAGVMFMCLMSGRNHLMSGGAEDIEALQQVEKLVGFERLRHAARTIGKKLSFSEASAAPLNPFEQTLSDEPKVSDNVSDWVRANDESLEDRLRAMSQGLFCNDPAWQDTCSAAKKAQRCGTEAPKAAWRLAPLPQGEAGGDTAGVEQLVQWGYQLLARCLDPNAKTRISAAEALQHPFFAGISPPTGNRLAERYGSAVWPEAQVMASARRKE